MFEYISDAGYLYRQRPDGHVIRIARPMGEPINGGSSRPAIGQIVTVIIKPYVAKKYVTGPIKRVLTRKRVHTRGHKVMLADGTVGRIVSHKL